MLIAKEVAIANRAGIEVSEMHAVLNRGYIPPSSVCWIMF